MKQRDMMRLIWRSHGDPPDSERVIREYAAREEAGEVARDSNRLNVPPLEYARRLLDDGLRKGWLTGALRNPVTRPKSIGAPKVATAVIPTATGRTWLEWADDAARAVGAEPESSQYLDRVRAWRAAWRPARVRVLLVAESHVAEQPGDADVLVRLPSVARPVAPLPEGYCRLVYCLGYGEPFLCAPRSPTRNGGTWQYWDLFGAVASAYNAGVAATMPRRAAADVRTRLDWKLLVLVTLRSAGVWLEDASIIALYSTGGGRRASHTSYDQLVRSSFQHFVWPDVAADEPEQVWVIGRGVGRALQGLPGVMEQRIISQPQDRDHGRFRADIERLKSALPRSQG